MAVAASSSTVEAQQRLGGEIQVNTYTSLHQSHPSVAVESDGGFIVVWESSEQDGSLSGIFGQRFASSGAPAGGEFQVNDYTTSYQSYPSVATDADGDFIVVWQSSGQDGGYYGVFGRRFLANGVAADPAFQVNTYTTDDQSNASVAMNGAGDFVVVWDSAGQDAYSFGVFGRQFDGAGAGGSEFPVNSEVDASQAFPSVAMEVDGDFVVVWRSYGQDGDEYGIFGRRFGSGGVPSDGDFQVNTHTTGGQIAPSVASDAMGNFVVVWASPGQDGGGFGILGRRFSSSGDPLGGEFQVNTHTTANQLFPAVAMDAAGNFVVAWQSLGQDGDGYGVFARRFGSNGTPMEGEFQVNTYTTSAQFDPAVAVDAAGGFVVAWASAGQDGDGAGIFAQRFRSRALDFFIGDEAAEAERQATPPAIDPGGKQR